VRLNKCRLLRYKHVGVASIKTANVLICSSWTRLSRWLP